MRIWARAAVAFAIAAAGCRRTVPATGSHLAIGQLASATTLDPHFQDDERTYSTLDHFYNKLVGFGPEMQVVPELALRWENLSDTEWKFHLRRGVRFHDGRPFGAADVRATIVRAQTMPGSRVGYYLQSIREVRVIDDATIVFVTREPNSVLLNKLVFIDIVPRDSPAVPIMRPMGTGPYEFVSGAPGERIEGRAFPGFWGAAPEFSRVSIVPLPGSEERARAIAAGAADVVGRFPEEYWEWAATQPALRLVSRQGISEVLLGFSSKAGSPFVDRRVREALCRALDRKELAARGLHGLAVPLDQIVPSTVFGYSSQLLPLVRDAESARRLLAGAGYPRGFEADLLLPDYLHGVAGELQRQLAPLGIRLRPIVLPFAAFNARWRRDEIPLALFGWGAGTGDASDMFDALLHSPVEGYGRSNRFGYGNSEMDRLIELADRTLDPRARQNAFTKAQEILRRDLPLAPLLLRYDLYALRKGLTWTPRPDRRLRAFDFRLAQPAG